MTCEKCKVTWPDLCPRHEAAGDLLAACEAAFEKEYNPFQLDKNDQSRLCHQLKAAIEKARRTA